MNFCLTSTRVEILRWLAQFDEPVYAPRVSQDVVMRPAYSSGHQPRYSRQQATRTAACNLRPLAEAGLVKVQPATPGWGMVQLTPEGRKVLAAYERDDGTLELQLEAARRRAHAQRCFWWTPRAQVALEGAAAAPRPSCHAPHRERG